MKKEIKDEYRRVQCNWCNSVFYEDYIVEEEDEKEACPLCGKNGYLMDIQPEDDKPYWETPYQWEKRTGKEWKHNWAVYCYTHDCSNAKDEWRVMSYRAALERYYCHFTNGIKLVVVATEAAPPDGWRPEEPE
jgi:NAD-dependent SIR2 family protein deacetylase